MQFYPSNSPIPAEKGTNRLHLRPLREADAALDYKAVMASAGQLHRWSQTSWPTPDFTLAANRADLARHEREHRERVAFTYTGLNPDGNHCLGCVYITPLESTVAQICTEATYAANVGFWVRSSEIATDLDRHLLVTLRDWFATTWLFECVTFIISQQETRQAALLNAVGLERRLDFDLSAGRPCWLFS